MVAYEATLLHAGMSWMARGYSHLSRLRRKEEEAREEDSSIRTAGAGGGTGGGAGGGSTGLVARAIVGCWNTLAWSISGATLNPLVVGALQETLGWPLQHAKAFAIMHAANLAAAVPDSPEYVSALSAVGVVGFLGMHPTATLALRR
jgi:hypothetical protein